jgi:hypothetical protein
MEQIEINKIVQTESHGTDRNKSIVQTENTMYRK